MTEKKVEQEWVKKTMLCCWRSIYMVYIGGIENLIQQQYCGKGQKKK